MSGAPKRGSLPYKIGAFSQFYNAWIGDGNRDQTFSARAWEGQIRLGGKWRVIRWIIDKIFFWEIDHCYQSYLTDAEFTYTNIDED